MSIKKFIEKKLSACVKKVYLPQKPRNLRNPKKMPIPLNFTYYYILIYVLTYILTYHKLALFNVYCAI